MEKKTNEPFGQPNICLAKSDPEAGGGRDQKFKNHREHMIRNNQAILSKLRKPSNIISSNKYTCNTKKFICGIREIIRHSGKLKFMLKGFKNKQQKKCNIFGLSREKSKKWWLFPAVWKLAIMILLEDAAGD